MSVKPSVKLGILGIVATTWIIIYVTFSSTKNQSFSEIVTKSFNQTSSQNFTEKVMVVTAARNNNLCLSTIKAPDMKKIRTFADLNTVLCENGKVHSDSSECPQKGIVTMIPGGRTGNMIWEYASIWVTAKETGLEPYVPSCVMKEMLGIFEKPSLLSLESIANCSVPKQSGFVQFNTEWSCKSQSIIIPRFYFQQSLLYHHRDEFLNELKFKKKLRDKAQTMLADAVKKRSGTNHTFVAVHVRRTDYIRYLKNKYNRRPTTPAFFLHAMDYYRKNYTNCIFIYISDDPMWCFQQFGKFSDVIVISSNHRSTAAEDLALMAECNHTIFDYGTFGQWGSIFAGGDAVYFNLLGKDPVKDKHILNNWIMMD